MMTRRYTFHYPSIFEPSSKARLSPCTAAAPVGGNANRRADPEPRPLQAMQRPKHHARQRTPGAKGAIRPASVVLTCFRKCFILLVAPRKKEPAIFTFCWDNGTLLFSLFARYHTSKSYQIMWQYHAYHAVNVDFILLCQWLPGGGWAQESLTDLSGSIQDGWKSVLCPEELEIFPNIEDDARPMQKECSPQN